MPDSAEFVNVIEDQLRKFLVDEYLDINIDEFEYAMRVCGTQIKDWGKSINLTLIREALDTYISQRVELSKIEEQKRSKPIEEVPADPVDWSDTWERLKRGEIRGVYAELVPYPSIYDWLEKTGQIKPKNADKWLWLRKACSKEVGRLSLLKESFQATADDKYMLERLKVIQWQEGKFPDDKIALSHLIAGSKTVAVMEILNKCDQ